MANEILPDALSFQRRAKTLHFDPALNQPTFGPEFIVNEATVAGLRDDLSVERIVFKRLI